MKSKRLLVICVVLAFAVLLGSQAAFAACSKCSPHSCYCVKRNIVNWYSKYVCKYSYASKSWCWFKGTFGPRSVCYGCRIY